MLPVDPPPAFRQNDRLHLFPMKRFALPLLAAATLAVSAQARVFETFDACVARYGKPVTTTKTNIGSNVAFLKNQVSVSIEFRKETAVAVTFAKSVDLKKPGENRAFSEAEIEKLLEANGAGHKWNRAKKDMHGHPYWTTEDKAVSAKLTDNTLRIEDGEEFARRSKDLPPPVKPAERDLEGF